MRNGYSLLTPQEFAVIGYMNLEDRVVRAKVAQALGRLNKRFVVFDVRPCLNQ